MKWCDGNWLADAAPLPAASGPAPFETMRAVGTSLPLWPRHRARLQAAAGRLVLPCVLPADLLDVAGELLDRNGHADGVVRLSLRPRAGATALLLTTRARAPLAPVSLIPCLLRRPPSAPPADLKCEPRDFYAAVQRQARAGGAADGIAIGDDGALLETAVGNLWLRLGGTWVTPPLDGRLLPGIARALVLERAAAFGLAVAEQRCDLGDLHRAQALAVTNAVHGPRAAGLTGATVAEPDSRLVALWRAAISD